MVNESISNFLCLGWPEMDLDLASMDLVAGCDKLEHLCDVLVTERLIEVDTEQK